ncbi:Flp pilus assembly protein TadG [Roseibacterium elongatum DSM 19469]|uniref:Flp pilus assembly protein TadG n=1 Tax=Roseicyclus elongatus DSM 19469 TaxID=1294273 RepID=W8RSQ4_9RHOB|nr:TadE/TadG family type IV pilus assembly protein [Roseibacterium elongatum]AHM04163.1 Flp pilus assembly protein TadG [Roseibacterium elongatum DSM 19469]
MTRKPTATGILPSRLVRFLRDETATATMEFVIIFPAIMMLFIASFETSMIMTRQVMLERTLDQAVRVLRLAKGLTVSSDDIRDTICANTSLLPDCTEYLTVDLQVIDRASYDTPDDNDLCVHRSDETASPQNQFTVGVDNDIMLVRVCMIVDRIVPFSGYGLNLTRDDSGGLHMTAASVFVNEPD